MAQFDVHKNIVHRTAADIPYLVNVQYSYFDVLETRLVIPLYRPEAIGPRLTRLNLVFEIERRTVVLATPQLVGMRRRQLGDRVANLSGHRYEILGAIDLLLTGV
jgi:toxin CcdB